MDRYRFFIYFLIISICFQLCSSKISDKRLCIDPDCKSPVSIAKTLTRYFSPEAYMLSFKANEEITIFSKSAGSNEDLWGAEIKGKRGYVPRGLVRETKIIGKPLLLVDTEIGYNSNATQVPIEKEAVKPSKVKQTYEIIDGTTVYPQLDEDIIEEAQEPSWSTENISEKNIDILESSKADNLEISLSPNVESTINHSKKESLSDATSENDTVNSVNVDNQESNQIEVENIENSQIEPINIHNEENNLNLNSESKEVDEKIDTTDNFIEKETSDSSESSQDDAGYLSGMFDNVLGMVMGDKDEETGKESEVDVKKGDEFVEKELDGTSSNATPEKDGTSSIPTPEKDFNEIVGDSLENKTEKTPELFSDDKSEVLTDNSANDEEKDAIADFLHNVEKKDSTDMNTVNIVSESVVSSENSLNEVETISASSEESKIENSQTNSESNSPTYSESNSPTDSESNSPTYSENNSTNSASNSPTYSESNSPTDLESNSPTFLESNSPTNSESNSIENKIDEEKLYENSTGSENLLQKVGEIVKENEAISNNSSEIMNDIDENLSKNEEIKQDDSHIEKNPSYGTLNSIDDYVKNEEKLLPTSTIEQVNQNPNLTLNNSQVEILEILSSSEPQNDVLEVSSNFLENTELGNSENDSSVENISNREDKKVSLPVVSRMTQNDFENIKFKDKLLEVGEVTDENNQNFEIKPENDINQVSDGKNEDILSESSPYQKFIENVEQSTTGNIYETPVMDDNQNTHQNIKDEEQGIIEETPLSNNTDYMPIVTENNYENQQQINIDSVNHQSEYKYTSVDTESFTSDKLNEKVDVDNIHTENQVNKQKSDGQENNDGIETGNDAPGIFSYFTKSSEENIEAPLTVEYSKEEEVSDENSERKMTDDYMDEKIDKDDFCIKTSTSFEHFPMELPNFGADFFLYLVTTAISVIIFMLGYLALDKSRREGPLIAKINKLEKEYLIAIREKEILAEEAENGIQKQDLVSSQEFLNLKQCYEDVVKEKLEMEDQIQTLEKELENSTEVGLELNRMLSDILSSENAGETLMTTIEGLQAQLAEQQGIVSNMKETLSLKETENHELNLDLDITNKKVVELQSELDKLLLNVIKVEEEKELQEKSFKSEIIDLKGKIDSLTEKLEQNQTECEKKIYELEHNLQLKIKEYDGLKNGIQRMKDNKKANNLESLVEVTSIKAELEQLEAEYQVNVENLRREKEINSILEKRTKHAEDEVEVIKGRFDEADKARLELETKLQVLTNYFKEKEAQLQKELTKYESMWSAKQGEATSTSERIKYLQSEVQNYKAQNESLKQEIISQEVELKSQISVLEKKVHENWVSARQAERRLEDVKQEAAQLRNRLTLRERALQEDKTHNRMQSPLEQNPDLPMSPLHMESPSSPPLLYSSRDHITKSPPILGMPPPFLPPPPGGPFLPPPHLSFMPPPPPDMFPGDHRPPPLGRMSSPPLNSRFSPGRSYSPYERSPSPSYDESEYGTSPVHHRRYSPFSERKNHRRMPKSSMGKINGNGAMSSGSNDSLDDINHSNSKV